MTTLGGIIPLPQSALEIPPELLQGDVGPPLLPTPTDVNAQQEPLLDDTENRPQKVVPTLPCSINLRRLDARDIEKWQPKLRAFPTVLDATREPMKEKLHLRQSPYPTATTYGKVNLNVANHHQNLSATDHNVLYQKLRLMQSLPMIAAKSRR